MRNLSNPRRSRQRVRTISDYGTTGTVSPAEQRLAGANWAAGLTGGMKMGAVGPFVLRRADGKFYAGSHQVRSGNVVPQWNVSSKWAHQYKTEQEATAASEQLKSRFDVEVAPHPLAG